MAKKDEAIALKKGKAQFMLIGAAKVNDTYTFSLDKESGSSDWIYNTMNVGIDCSNGNVVYADMMGGYGSDRDNVIKVHGLKEEDGKKKEDYDNRFDIDWDDRFDDDILETVGDSCFIKVGLEKDTKGKTFTKKFLAVYDAIEYIQQHLQDGMVVNAKGNLKYQPYNDSITVKKEVTSIFLSKAEPEDYKATFTQTLLVDSDAVGKLDKEKAVFPISAYVVDYIGKIDGEQIKKNVALTKTFELEIDKAKPENTKKLIAKMFTPKKKGTLVEVTVEGDIVEGTSVVSVTLDDLPDDIKDLIDLNVITEEEAISRCSISGAREKRLIIKKPFITFEGEGETKIPTLAINKDKYTENDLVFLSQLINKEDKEDKAEKPATSKPAKTKPTKKDEEPDENEDSESDDPDAWMKLLDD